MDGSTIRFRGGRTFITKTDFMVIMALNEWDGACPSSNIRDPSTHRKANINPELGIELLSLSVKDGKPLYRSDRYFDRCPYVLAAARENKRARSIVYVNPIHYDIFDDMTIALKKNKRRFIKFLDPVKISWDF